MSAGRLAAAGVLVACLAVLVAADDAQDNFVRVLLTDAAAKDDAVCLDGTPAAYYLSPFKNYTRNDHWIVFLEGGGWCRDAENCVERSKTPLGSSSSYPPLLGPSYEGGDGLLSDDPALNPTFYFYRKAYVRYCDGASFAGNVAGPVNVNGSVIHFRGFHILNAVFADLRTRGMANATSAILAGCSAGGLATYQHCDYFSEQFSQASTACIADAGYFPDFESTSGTYVVRDFYHVVVDMQNTTIGMNQACLAANPSQREQCFFPQNVAPYLKTRTFALNSGYDSWQTKADWFAQDPAYDACSLDLNKCTPAQVAVLQRYHSDYIKSDKHGAFINSCHVHCQSAGWAAGTTVQNLTRAQAVGQWFEGKPTKLVDCPWPCQQPGSSC